MRQLGIIMHKLLLIVASVVALAAGSVVIANSGDEVLRSPEPRRESPAAAHDQDLYCVARTDEVRAQAPKDCTFVERIEDVPRGATLWPSHGGLDDPEEIRRYWCVAVPEVAGDELPSPNEVDPGCLKYFAEAFGGEYAKAYEAQTDTWCVREGDPTTFEGCDHIVDRIEQVPEGAVWIPTHCGLDDPERVRRECWGR